MDELSGSIVPLVTPLLEQGVDFISLEKLLKWHEDSSTTAFIILGSTGEGTLLSMDERASIIEFVVQKSDLPVWVGVSAMHHTHAMELINQANDLGADGVMVTAPLYVKPSQRALISYFTKIADESELEVLLYNHPGRTGSSIEVETACILSDHEKIIGIKDVEINLDRMTAYQQSKPDFSVFCGDDEKIMMCLSNGGAGVISVISNIVPELVQAVCLLTEKQIYRKADAIAQRWDPLVRLLSESNPGAIKYAMSNLNLIEPLVKPPLTMLTESQKARLDEALTNILPLLNLNPEYED